ncbi:SCO4225 family membrane protein [Streptomyces enissocaesilis]|uniref:ABC transporter permease n=1 Tax=Streptomyces enissocaesilis TaxID=332589 RepID=A0ABN3X7Y2_9ACTN
MIARKLFRRAFANPISAAYLGVVGTVTVFEVAAAFIEGPQEFAGLWVLMTTSPTALLFLGVAEAIGGGAGPEGLLFVILAVSAFIQSLALGLLWEVLRSGRENPGRPRHS